MQKHQYNDNCHIKYSFEDKEIQLTRNNPEEIYFCFHTKEHVFHKEQESVDNNKEGITGETGVQLFFDQP